MIEGKDDRGSKKQSDLSKHKDAEQRKEDRREDRRWATTEVERSEVKTEQTAPEKDHSQQVSKTEVEPKGTWTVEVSIAVSAQSLGQFVISPLDLVQDLKARIASQLCPTRPWAVNGKLLHGSSVLEEKDSLKDAGVEDSSDLQFLSLMTVSREDALPRNELLLLPEVLNQVLNPCTIKAYQPKVQWVLESFVTRGSDAELEQDWAHASAREGVQCEDLTNPEGSGAQQSSESENWQESLLWWMFIMFYQFIRRRPIGGMRCIGGYADGNK